MARKQNPFSEGNHPEALRRKRRKTLEDLGRKAIYDEARPDELKQQDEQAADYDRRKKIINTPFRKIVF